MIQYLGFGLEPLRGATCLLHVHLGLHQIHQVGVNIRRAGAKLQVGDPKKNVGSSEVSCMRVLPNEATFKFASFVGTNLELEVFFSAVTSQIQCKPIKRGTSERRPSLVRRLSVLPKPSQRRTL
jgi:hypothetical protein